MSFRGLRPSAVKLENDDDGPVRSLIVGGVCYRKDEFTVECPALGTLKKLRIGHDNSGVAPGWALEKVIVEDLETNGVYEFPCGGWLAKMYECDVLSWFSADLLCLSVSPRAFTHLLWSAFNTASLFRIRT